MLFFSPVRRVRFTAAAAALVVTAACSQPAPPVTSDAGNPAVPHTAFPNQRLTAPVNALASPYARTEGWGALWPSDDFASHASVTGIAVGGDDAVFVLTRCYQNTCRDRSEAPIVKLAADGTRVAAFGQGVFDTPHSLTLSKTGDIWVTDQGGNTIRKFTPDGQLALTIGTAGQAGDPPSRLTSPGAIAIGPDGNVYVTEGHEARPSAAVNRVSVWGPDGHFVRMWGRTGGSPGEFSVPHALAFDSQGRVLVGDRNNNRIQVFDKDGAFLDLWYQFGRPSAILVGANDRLYVSDSESNSATNPGWLKGIRIGSAKTGLVDGFLPDLEPTTVSPSGSEGLALDSHGVLYASVVRRRTVARFTPGPGGASAASAVPAAGSARGHLALVTGPAAGGYGLAALMAADAGLAIRETDVASLSPTDIDAMKQHIGRAKAALVDATGGAGQAAGLKPAADAAASHLDAALASADASSAIKLDGPRAASAAKAISARAQAVAELCDQVLASTTAPDASHIVEQVRLAARWFDHGVDANSTGRIEFDAVEPGLLQFEGRLYAILESDRLPRALR